mmetsp:Transcript_16268/g.24120  ORF Transcript_16268/g.24120 Transcript_16268/m.24120 type:complete len:269 (+) Transcript_16268:423-1229(+)
MQKSLGAVGHTGLYAVLLNMALSSTFTSISIESNMSSYSDILPSSRSSFRMLEGAPSIFVLVLIIDHALPSCSQLHNLTPLSPPSLTSFQLACGPSMHSPSDANTNRSLNASSLALLTSTLAPFELSGESGEVAFNPESPSFSDDFAKLELLYSIVRSTTLRSSRRMCRGPSKYFDACTSSSAGRLSEKLKWVKKYTSLTDGIGAAVIGCCLGDQGALTTSTIDLNALPIPTTGDVACSFKSLFIRMSFRFIPCGKITKPHISILPRT